MQQENRWETVHFNRFSIWNENHFVEPFFFFCRTFWTVLRKSCMEFQGKEPAFSTDKVSREQQKKNDGFMTLLLSLRLRSKKNSLYFGSKKSPTVRISKYKFNETNNHHKKRCLQPATLTFNVQRLDFGILSETGKRLCASEWSKH